MGCFILKIDDWKNVICLLVNFFGEPRPRQEILGNRDFSLKIPGIQERFNFVSDQLLPGCCRQVVAQASHVKANG